MTDETGEHVVETPTFVQEEFVSEHAHTDDVREAHPIDEDVLHEVCDTKMGPMLLEYDLALVQAIAVREVLPYNCDHEHWITVHPNTDEVDLHEVANPRDRPGRLHYYQVDSQSFYEILSMAYHRYGGSSVYVEIDDAPDIAEAHTRQYLKDVHGYTGDFGGQVPNPNIDKIHEPTLCNAQNDAHWLRDEEPESAEIGDQSSTTGEQSSTEDAHYAFTDARGLVIEEGTHER